MKKIIEKMGVMVKVIFAVIILAVFFGAPAFAQVLERFENKDIKITSKLYPVYLGWNVHAGSTTQTVPFYYKITATVNGIGETKASPVTTAYATYSPTSSTNSIRLKWSPVSEATSYTLYRSADNSSFYFLTNTNLLTFIDDGDANGAAFSEASPSGGNLSVENDVTIGDDLSVSGDVTVTGVVKFVPETLTLAAMNLASRTAGSVVYVSDGVSATKICVSSATAGGFVLITSTSTHCQ